MRIRENNVICLLLFSGLNKRNSTALNFNKQNIFSENISRSTV